MTHLTRPAHLFLKLNLFALALLHVCVFAPQLRAWQDAMPTLVPPAQSPVGVVVGDPITKEWLLDALRGHRPGEAELVRQVQWRGSSFFPTTEDEKELTAAGATEQLLEVVRKNYLGAPWVATRRAMGGGMGGGPIGYGGDPGRPNGAVDYTRPFRQSEVTRRAVITFKPEPGFTEEARKNTVEGVVRLRTILDASGKVTNITAVKGLPDGLTEKAIAAARLIKFTPAEKDGRKVSQYVVLEYNFTVRYEKGQVDERAIILEKPEAEYTEEARRNNVRGKVVLRVTLTSFGSVVVEWVKAGLPHSLTEKAVEAARRIKFEPARLGGRAVSQSATVEYVFAP